MESIKTIVDTIILKEFLISGDSDTGFNFIELSKQIVKAMEERENKFINEVVKEL